MDPTLNKEPDRDFTLKSVKWYPLEMMLDVECKNKDYVLEYGDPMFKDILPEGEYTFIDPDTGLIFALMDEHFNLHWLVRTFTGHIQHKVVYLKPILEDIARRKYYDWT